MVTAIGIVCAVGSPFALFCYAAGDRRTKSPVEHDVVDPGR
jgi:hypothetical protein